MCPEVRAPQNLEVTVDLELNRIGRLAVILWKVSLH